MNKRVVECFHCYGYGQMISCDEVLNDETCPMCDGFAFLYKWDESDVMAQIRNTTDE